MLNDSEIGSIIRAEEDDALGYRDELAEKRATLMSYYRSEPLGDETPGRSRFVSSDVSDIVEWMQPSLLRVLVSGKHVATFDADTEEQEQEAEQKTALANYSFMRANNGTLTLHHMLKDGNLQYTGVVKTSWRETEETTTERYSGMSEDERRKLLANDETEIVEEERDEDTLTWRVTAKRTTTRAKVCYDNIPPGEFVIARNARDFERPRLIGQRTPKTRSDLVQMGFPRDLVDSLPADSEDKRNEDRNRSDSRDETNPSMNRANDIIYLGEYYVRIDVDEDGVAELWQVFYAGNQVLEKELWDVHPFAVYVPVPIPHQAIGSCPAEQVADIHLTKSVLVRHLLENVYANNYTRTASSNLVDLDDLMTPRPGGNVSVDVDGPVSGHVEPIPVTPQVDHILAAIEYMDTAREIRTGVTRYNQGLQADTLNKTATGFQGIMDASLQRMELMARLAADVAVRQIYRLTVMLLTKYQDEALQIRVSGAPLEVDPTAWRYDLDCQINVGLGPGERAEKIANLGAIIREQKEAIDTGKVIADQSKLYNAYSELVEEVGEDTSKFFNDPSQPEQLLKAQNELLQQMVGQLETQLQNPLAEAEMIKQRSQLAQFDEEQKNEMRRFIAEEMRKWAELELEHKQDIPNFGIGR